MLKWLLKPLETPKQVVTVILVSGEDTEKKLRKLSYAARMMGVYCCELWYYHTFPEETLRKVIEIVARDKKGNMIIFVKSIDELPFTFTVRDHDHEIIAQNWSVVSLVEFLKVIHKGSKRKND